MDGLGIGQNHNHLLGALRKSAFYRLWHMDFVRPLLRTNGITMKRIDDWIASRFLFRIAGWQEDKHLPIDRIRFQVSFERRTVNLDSLHCHGLRTGNHRRNVGLYLRGKWKGNSYAGEQ